jgi:hypothetical protein
METKQKEEYPRYPLETLWDGVGDCEDSSILAAAILDATGYDTVLLQFGNHMAVGVAETKSDEFSGDGYIYNEKKYYYLETTGAGYEVGVLPKEGGRTPQIKEEPIIYELVPLPALNHTWESEIRGKYLTLTATVSNLGSIGAEDAYIRAGFETEDGQIWNAEESETFDLEPDYEISPLTLQLTLPQEEHVRLLVQIIDDGSVVDESRSEWLDAG